MADYVQVERTSWMRGCSQYRLVDSDGQLVTFVDRFEDVEWTAQEDDIEIVVEDGDRLDLLAHKLYGSPRLWWVLALRNQIDLPGTACYAGRVLKAPRPERVKRVI